MDCIVKQLILLSALLGLVLLSPIEIRAEDWREDAGAAVGMIVGNSFYIPKKATLVVLSAPISLLAFVTTAGIRKLQNNSLRTALKGPTL